MHAPINYAKRQAKLCEVVESGTRSVVSENAITSEWRQARNYIHSQGVSRSMAGTRLFRVPYKSNRDTLRTVTQESGPGRDRLVFYAD